MERRKVLRTIGSAAVIATTAGCSDVEVPPDPVEQELEVTDWEWEDECDFDPPNPAVLNLSVSNPTDRTVEWFKINIAVYETDVPIGGTNRWYGEHEMAEEGDRVKTSPGNALEFGVSMADIPIPSGLSREEIAEASRLRNNGVCDDLGIGTDVRDGEYVEKLSE